MPGVTPAEVLSNFGLTLVEDPAENQPRLLVDLPAAELVEVDRELEVARAGVLEHQVVAPRRGVEHRRDVVRHRARCDDGDLDRNRRILGGTACGLRHGPGRRGRSALAAGLIGVPGVNRQAGKTDCAQGNDKGTTRRHGDPRGRQREVKPRDFHTA